MVTKNNTERRQLTFLGHMERFENLTLTGYIEDMGDRNKAVSQLSDKLVWMDGGTRGGRLGKRRNC